VARCACRSCWSVRLFSSRLFAAPSSSAISTLSLHDALPIFYSLLGLARSAFSSPKRALAAKSPGSNSIRKVGTYARAKPAFTSRSEEHTSELQSRENLVCRLLLEKKKHPAHIAHETLELAVV